VYDPGFRCTVNRRPHCQPTATHPGVGTRARDRTVEDLAWLETSWHLDLKWLVGVGVDDLNDVPFLYTRRDLNFYDLQRNSSHCLTVATSDNPSQKDLFD
jgi:hypothetical protein